MQPLQQLQQLWTSLMLIPASPEAVAALPEIDPLLAWGVLTRGLGVVYAIAFASIAVQIRGLAGRDGMSPFAPMMQQMAHDFPGWRRLLYFPTLLWLTGGGDAALVGLPVAGVGFGLAAAYGGAASPLALAACWATLRSLDLPVGLLYPWDSLLLEAGALATLLPPLPPLTSAVAAAAAPHPWVGFAFRWLLFRLMVGFGKKKFVGTSLKHSCYVKNFLIGQPIPSPIGWLAYRAPLPLFQAALVVMFVVECVAPFFLFAGGAYRQGAALLIAALMVGIQAGGNFGHFNLLTIVLCAGSLDGGASAWAPLPPLGPTEAALRVAVGLHTLLSLFFLPFDSWCATGWAHWPEIALARKAWVRALVGGCRAAADARVLHSYGVFPPASNPPMRFAPALEGSLDGVTWRRYEWKWLPSSPSSSPRFVAPHHPRLDHSLFYTSFGTGPDNFLATINAPRPYGLSHHSMLHRLGARLLDGAPLPVRRLFRHDPFPPTGPPPRFVRVRLLLLRPHDLGDAASTGGWWAESEVDAVHMPTLSASPVEGVESEPPPPLRQPPPHHLGARHPVLFHPDLMVVWRQRCPELRALLAFPLWRDKMKEGNAVGAERAAINAVLLHCVGPNADDGSPGFLGPAWVRARLARQRWEPDQRPYPELQSKQDLDPWPTVDAFYEDFVPFAAARGALSKWAKDGGLPAAAEEARGRWGGRLLYAFELCLGGVTLRLVTLLEELHLRRALPHLGNGSGTVPSYFHLTLLAHCIVLKGKTAVGAALRSTEGAAAAAAAVSAAELAERGLSFYGVLWVDAMIFHARKHWVAHETQRKFSAPPEWREPVVLPGFLLLLPTIGAALAPLVCADQHFPTLVPPGPLGDWTIGDAAKNGRPSHSPATKRAGVKSPKKRR